MAIDLQHLKRQLTQATQTAFAEMLAQHREEGGYSFALYSDEGALTVCPATNTLAHLAAQPPDDLPYVKLEPAEWRYENVGAIAQFDTIGRQLRTHVLDELRQQQFFDRAAGCEVFLLFSVSDSDTSAAELAQLAKQLNHNAYRDEYLAWLASWEA